MGRHRKFPVDNDVVTESSLGNREPSEAVMRRIGLFNKICMDCNANSPPDADACRKCGSSNLRQKKRRYQDGG